METISAEEFKKRYGEVGLQQMQQAATSSKKPGAISSAFNSGVSQAKEGYTQAANSNGNPLTATEGALKVGAGAINAATAPLAPLFKPVGKAVDYVADKISDIPAVQKFASSKAGETTQRVVEDVNNLNTITGAIAGGKQVPKTAAATARVVGDAGGAVGDAVGGATRAIGDKASELVTPIEAKTKTMLQESPKQRIMSYAEQGERALNDPRELTPFDMAGEKAKSVLTDLKSRMDTEGGTISKVLKEKGSTSVGNIVQETRTNLRQKLHELGGMIDQKGGVKNGPNRTLRFSDASDKKLVQNVDTILSRISKNPTLQQVDDAISSIDDQLFKRKSLTAVPVNTQLEATLKNVIGELNSKMKKIGGDDFSKAKSNYSRIKGIHADLNKVLGSEGNKGGALFKRFFSPSDAGTKKLFDAIRKETGVDLAQDATIAKWVMETLGDKRSASILEGIPTSRSGVMAKVVGKAVESMAGGTVKRATIKKGINMGKN